MRIACVFLLIAAHLPLNMADKRSSVLFNKNASPFYPAAVPPPPPRAYAPFGPSPPCDVELSNLPLTTALDIHDFVTAQLPASGAVVVDHQQNHAVVRFAAPGAAAVAVDTLDGTQWLGNTILAALIAAPTPQGTPQADSSAPGSSYYYMPPPFGYPVDYGYYGGGPMGYAPPYGYYGVSPVATRTPSRRSSLRSVSRQNSVNSNYKPLPPFVLNMVKHTDSMGAVSPIGDADHGLISVDDEDGNPIKVNPRRLFVGNIPFHSTWPALKSFLVTRADELEPGNSIEIHRVEIPMQQPRDSGSDQAKLNSYQFLTLLLQLLDKSDASIPDTPRAHSGSGPTRGMSRGFAIVTTANKMSLDKIIELFDNVEFEGRTLTVRYDRFPDFNNYVLQQLYPSNKSAPANKPAFLSNLAFERNSFQHKFYYGHAPMPPYTYQRPPASAFTRSNGEITVDEFHGPLDEIQMGFSADLESTTTPTLFASDDEKARELVNSFATSNVST